MVERWSWLGDLLAIDVANTVQLHGGAYVDLLQTPDDLAEWVAREGPRLPALITAVQSVQLYAFSRARDAILAMLRSASDNSAPPAAAVHIINRSLLDHPAVRLLTSAGEVGPARLLHPRGPIDDIIAEATFNLVELLNGTARAQLNLCRAPSCGQIFLRDRANQRWCSDTCGNRARGARHHQRARTPE